LTVFFQQLVIGDLVGRFFCPRGPGYKWGLESAGDRCSRAFHPVADSGGFGRDRPDAPPTSREVPKLVRRATLTAGGVDDALYILYAHACPAESGIDDPLHVAVIEIPIV